MRCTYFQKDYCSVGYNDMIYDSVDFYVLNCLTTSLIA